MRQLLAGSAALLIAASAGAQSSIAACGPLPDSTSRQAIKVFGDLRVCLVATRVVGTDAELPQEWAAKGAQVIMETQRPNDNRRAAIDGDRVAWTINGRPAPIDTMADRWQRSVLELLDAGYEADALRSEASNLRTEIDSLPARRQSTRDRIVAIERMQRDLDQQMLSLRNLESRINSDISRLERQKQDLTSRASSEERRGGSGDERDRQAAQQRAQQYYAQARQVDRQILDLSNQLRRSDPAKRMADLQGELRGLNGDNSIALLRMKLDNYDSTRVEDLEAQLTRLDAPRRLPALEARVEAARLALLAVLEARGRARSR